jgi:sterol desaturase/sphingolipid hydroxylase (fatty acid hydroxylase superfamily)
MNPFAALADFYHQLHQGLFEQAVLPLVVALGMNNLLEEAYAGTEFVLLGLGQILVMLLVLAPLERWRPVEPLRDRQAVRVDVVYTLIHRLGLFRLAMFFTVDPLIDAARGLLHGWGFGGLQLDAHLPAALSGPVAVFLIYLVVLDFVEYWLHRAQHRFDWWWALHAVHHSQRQMTLWSDDRNHLLDSVLIGLAMAVVAALIGVPPGQYVLLIALGALLQSLQHANLRLSFGALGERLVVSPRFHRLHHAIGVGHESAAGRGTLGGCNFGVLFPWWDLLFLSARFDAALEPTGIRDQLPEEGGRDYGRGFWAQQWLGLRRMVGRG